MADELTEALEELRTLFPENQTEIVFRSQGPAPVRVTVWENDIIPRRRVSRWGSALSEAMAQVRSWKAAQEKTEL